MPQHGSPLPEDQYNEPEDNRNGGHCPIHGDETHWSGGEEEEEAGLAWCPSCQALVKFTHGEEEYDPGENPYERSGRGAGYW